MTRYHVRLLMAVAAMLGGGVGSSEARGRDNPADVTIAVDEPETAGICGFRQHWDTPVPLAGDGLTSRGDLFQPGDPPRAEWSPMARKGRPGAIAFDALERSALVRFPSAAEQVAGELKKGYRVAKAELVLPWRATELFPPGNGNGPPGPDGYAYRANWGVDAVWRKDPPRWHAVAFRLRRPWAADEKIGPTYNAFINGAGFWAHCGARDADKDRFPDAFGPTEVSGLNAEGRMDVTAALASPAYGKTLADRLRALSDCGFLLQKWETYDHRYFDGVYEWGTATGGRAILIGKPKLVVTMVPGAVEIGLPAPRADVAALAEQLKGGAGGKPTAVMPTPAELRKYAAAAAAKPAWMPDWQWQHVRDLKALDGPERANRPFWYDYTSDYMVGRARDRLLGGRRGAVPDPALLDREVYGSWVDALIGRQPRGWAGFEAAREMSQWYAYGPTLPLPARDAIRRYWTAWLMPDRKTAPPGEHLNPKSRTGELVHPMVDQLSRRGGGPATGDSYYALTGDWRGNKSFYRSGFNYTTSTQNFNTTAATGALLGGAIIDSDAAAADGRHGVENFLGRLWAWGSGSSQEYVDHYYFAVTLSGYKAIADYGPTPFDRLSGEMLLLKGMDELTGCYHPGLRRFVAGSSRTGLDYLLGKQDGLQYLLHSVSRSGALTDVGATTGPFGIPLWGRERDPAIVALQTMPGPWLPEWAVGMVDGKPIPFEVVSRQGTAWWRGYLGANYGLASKDTGGSRVQVLGQWRTGEKQAASYKDVVTMDVRYGINQTRWVDAAPGWIAPIGLAQTLQHKNKMVAVLSPWPADFLKDAAKKQGLKSLQASVGLFQFREQPPGGEIYLDGKKVDGLPVIAKAGQKVTIRFGVTYLAVVPLPGTDLGRDAEVTIRQGDDQYPGDDRRRPAVRASLVIDSYNLLRPSPAAGPIDWGATDKAYAGFAIELGDQSEWGSFDRFRDHIAAARVDASCDATAEIARASYASGSDTLELGVYTRADSGAPGHIAFRRVNGTDPTPVEGIDRDTTLARQGRTGRVEKNGAVLSTDAGQLGYLLTEPAGGTYAGLHPFPEPTSFALEVPGGMRVVADGSVGLCRVVANPKEKTVSIDVARKPRAANPPTVKAFVITGTRVPPRCTLNGRGVEAVKRGDSYSVEVGE